MKRRHFLAASAAALVVPAARAQGQPPVVGFVNDSGSNSGPGMIAFLRGLSRAGFITNQTVLVMFQQADKYDEAPALAQNLARRNVAAIVALNTPNMALAAREATKTIPIVFAIGGDPERLGLVESLGKPGGNATGVVFTTPALFDERARLALGLGKPGAPVGHLVNPTNRGAEFTRADFSAAVARAGGQALVFDANSAADIDAAFAAAADASAGALVVDDDSRLGRMRDKIIAAAARHKIATIYPDREAITSGGLASLGDIRADQLRQLGESVGRVLKGEKPAAIPVAAPAKFEMALNLKTAAALGLTVPAAIRAAAAETVE